MRKIRKAFTDKWWVGIGVFLLVGVVLRVVGLERWPDGLHFDEAWFGYNAWLLGESGRNIYGDKWPLSVDMFGDHVSAMHAYVSVPLVKLLGLSAVSIRLTVALFSVGTMLVGTKLMWLMTRSKQMVLVFVGLTAVSSWQIVMTRASSTVVIDSLMLLVFLWGYWEFLTRLKSNQWQNSLVWAGMCYGLSVLTYFTYFSSRLLIVPMAMGLLVWMKHMGIIEERKKIWWGLAPLLLYLVFPFGLMLGTPYAMGRFSQTSVINHMDVATAIRDDHIRSSQGGAPVWLMRAVHNKVTENVRVFTRQYVTFLSPEPMLFEMEKPPRYQVPNVGPVSVLELTGLYVALVIGLIGFVSERKQWQSVAILFVWWVMVALIPSALTMDDFPNLQRGVIAVPYWQMAAAVGVGLVLKETLKWKVVLRRGLVLGMAGVYVMSLLWFGFNYVYQASYFEPYHRNVVGMKVAEWINTNAKEAKILAEEKDGYFLLALVNAKDNILDMRVEKTGKYFLGADEFQIGERTYVNNLCKTDKIITRDYEYMVLSVKDGCSVPWWMDGKFEGYYKNDVRGMVILKPDEGVKTRYLEELEKARTEEAKNKIIDTAWLPEKPIDD